VGERTVAKLGLPRGAPHVDAHDASAAVAQILAVRDRPDERYRLLAHLLRRADRPMPKARSRFRQRLRVE
jgi:hypothetical protein